MTDFIRRHGILAAIIGVFVLLVLFYSFPIVPETKEVVVVRFGKPVEDMVEQRLACDRHHGLRHLVCQRPHARAEASGENHG